MSTAEIAPQDKELAKLRRAIAGKERQLANATLSAEPPAEIDRKRTGRLDRTAQAAICGD